MGQSAEELRQEIAGTRTELGETLDAIGDRVSPGRVIERRKNRMTNGLRSAKDRIMGTAGSATDTAGSAVDTVKAAPEAARSRTQGNPMAAGAVAFGVGFLVAAAFPPSRPEEEAAEKVLEKAEPIKEQLKEAGQQVASNLSESATEAAQQVRQSAVESAQQVSDTAKDAAAETKDAVRDAGREATSS